MNMRTRHSYAFKATCTASRLLLLLMAISIVLWLSFTALGAHRTLGIQIPLFTEDSPSIAKLDTTWDFDQRPSVNATGNFVFQTVGSLLQHWPNTLYRNGHTLVPGTVPSGTLLYHGARRKEIPHRPGWVATDPEHASLFCLSMEGQGCWQLTLMTTRPLNILYFDGSSAAKMPGGTMDSQDVVAWGRVRLECLPHEVQRIHDLCKWGKKYHLDGFVRMEMDFEIMLCDFNKGTQVVSLLNLPVEDIPPPPTSLPPPPKIPKPNPTGDCPPLPPLPSPLPKLPPPPPLPEWFLQKIFLVTESGSWHRHYPGDSRIQLDLTRLVSFYDMELFPSLVLERFGKERWEYRLEGISKKDVKEMYKRLDEVLDSKGRSVGGSDVDWEAVVRVIMKRYGERLEVLRYILRGKDESEEQERNYTAIIVETQKHATTMLTPYITRDDVTPQVQNDTNLLSWAVPVFEKCATAYVDSLRTSFYARMTRSEQLIFNSIRDTVKEICRVLVRVWAESSAFKQPVLDGSNSHQHRASGLKELVNRWEKDISGLMQWLAWDIWTNCRPACGFEEICYLPGWPFFYGNPKLPPPKWDSDNPPPGPPEAYGLPEPFCIRRLPPYKLNREFSGNVTAGRTNSSMN